MNIETLFNTEDIKRYYFPGRILIGRGVLEHSISLCRDARGPTAVIVDSSICGATAVDEILNQLRDVIVATKVVRGRPVSQEVEEFVQSLATPPAIVLAIGGGSTSDFAKAVVSYFYFGEIDGVGLGRNLPTPRSAAKPLLIIMPTTAGSGAEASRYFVTYDKNDQHKVFGRSWSLIADWIILDPQFLDSVPADSLVACAFDAFVHLFETFVCRHEKSRMGEMLSLHGIPHLMKALDQAIYRNDRSLDVHEVLIEAATLGGMAIANVRTGNIHEAGGALLELTTLSHPETLFVFFRDAIEQYLPAIGESEKLLISHLGLVPTLENLTSIDDVITWWENIFSKVGLVERIRDVIEDIHIRHPMEKVRDHIFQRVYSDKVWINKECPIQLDEQSIFDLIDKALKRFGAVNA